MRGLARIRRVGHSLPVRLKLQLYNALVLPHTDYCSVIWIECSQHLQMKIERIQNFGMRVILDKPPHTPKHDSRTILKWKARRAIHRLELVHRCLIGLAPPNLQAHIMTNASLVTTRQKGMTNFTFLSPEQTFKKIHLLLKGHRPGIFFPPHFVTFLTMELLRRH